jgi:hypothetical protein
MKKEYCIPKVNTIHLENHIDLLQPSPQEPVLPPTPMGLAPCDDASSKPFEDVG